MSKQVISTEKAPKAIGPYSQGIKTGNLVFTSGQLPIDISTGKLVSDDIKEATKHCLNNISSVLEAAGTSLDKVVKTAVFLKNLDDFTAMNEVYSSYFSENSPARSCIQVAKLPMDAIVEIEAIAEI